MNLQFGFLHILLMYGYIIMSGSYYTLNAKYNQLLALVQAGGGGGGGGITNPLTADLDANNYQILNASNYTGVNMSLTGQVSATTGIVPTMTVATELNANEINDTTAQTYRDLGAIAAGNKYELAFIPNPATAEGCITVLLRGLDTAFKQQVFLEVIGYADKAAIRIINNLDESDNPIFSDIGYGLSAGGTNTLYFTCSAPSAKTECAIYQNQQARGTSASYGTYFEIPTGLAGIITTTIDYAVAPLTSNTSGGNGNVNTGGNTTMGGTMSAPTAAIDTIQDLNGVNVSLVGTDLLCGGNSVKNANTVETAQLASPFTEIALLNDINTNGKIMRSNAAAPNNVVKMESDLTMLGGNIIETNSITADTINSNGAANITITKALDMSALKIENLLAPTANTDAATKLYVDTTAGSSGVQNPMVADLDCGAFNVDNIGSLNTVSGNSIIRSNDVFIHGTAGGATVFSIGGTTTDFKPTVSWKILDQFGFIDKLAFDAPTSVFSLGGVGGTVAWNALDGTTTDYKLGATLSTQSGSTTSIGGLMTLNGLDITNVNRITGVSNVDTGMTATGVGSNIVLLTDGEAVNVVASTLNCKQGDINTTNTGASGSGTAGTIVITNGVRARAFDDALAVSNYALNEVMDGRNHSFLEGYGNFFTSQELPRQTSQARGSFGVKLRAVVNDATTQFVSVRMMPQAAENPGGIQPEINYSRLTFQGTGAAPAYQNDTLTVAPNRISTPTLQENRFQNGSELFIQIKCVYATTTSPTFYAPLHYTVSFSGVESTGQVCSGSADCAWNGNNVLQNNFFGFEVLTESVGGITRVDQVEMFNDGMVSSF